MGDLEFIMIVALMGGMLGLSLSIWGVLKHTQTRQEQVIALLSELVKKGG